MRIVVVGGFNLDLITHVARRPERGEALAADSFAIVPGGKGFNQAVAARRLGAEVAIVGRVGSDAFALPFMDAMQAEGVDATQVGEDAEEGTGIGMPIVFPDGANSIVYAPRANLRLTAGHVAAARNAIAGADMLLIQLEVPMEANLEAVRIAQGAGVPVMLNPAPASDLPEGLLEQVAFVVPNEVEAAMLAHDALPAPAEKARSLFRPGMVASIVTLGERGAVYFAGQDTVDVPPFRVETVDSVGAGDAFCAGLAVATLLGMGLADAVRFASAAGAVAVTRPGASSSLPTRAEVEALLRGGAGLDS